MLPITISEDLCMTVALVVMLLFFPTAVKRMVASGYSRQGAMITWLLCIIVGSTLGYVIFGKI
jgi:uncharacterized membrane protein